MKVNRLRLVRRLLGQCSQCRRPYRGKGMLCLECYPGRLAKSTNQKVKTPKNDR